MKNLIQIFLIIACLFSVSFVHGQGGSPHAVRVLAQPDGSRILLRWVPLDRAGWKEGNEHGYKVERYTLKRNGVMLGGLDAANSRVILEANLQPLTESAWTAQFPDNNFGKLAKGALYQEDPTIQINGDPTLADALNQNESEETRFLFGLFAAEQDFEVAKGMALGFEDVSAQTGEEYVYTIKMNSTDPAFASVRGVTQVNFDAIPQLPAVTELQGEGMNLSAMIQWNIEEASNSYSSYDIERSTDGTNFSKVNELPFVFGTDAPEDPKYAIYRDSFDNNTTVYHYRVSGRTAFGTQGPPSAVIQLKGVPPRVNMFLSIDENSETDANGATLSWNNFDDAMQGHVAEFNVYRSLHSNRAYEKVNVNPLKPQDRSFTDPNPIPSAYYQLEAIDQNGHFYSSPAALVQLPDTVPPAIPLGFTGEFITPTRVELIWDANTEVDLQGYRIFVANKLESQYTQITPRPVEEEHFVYDIEPRFIAEHIYFKISAVDIRDNFSEKSEAIELDRPDKIAPSNPVLYKADPTPAGIEFGFRFSSSPDVIVHVLQRKPSGAPGWQDILTINENEETDYHQNLTPDNITSTCHIDTTILERREYDFRMLAYDDNKNVSSSDIIHVRPYDNGKRGTVSGVNAIAECVPVGDIPNAEAFELVDYLLLYYKETGDIAWETLEKLVYFNIITAAQHNDLIQLEAFEVNVFLTQLKVDVWGANVIAKNFVKWDYDSKDQLMDFQIFRSAEGSPMMLYHTLPFDETTELVFEDEDVRPGRRYFYQIMARHRGGGFSDRSEMVMVKVPKY